jgi:hypothetical protein
MQKKSTRVTYKQRLEAYGFDRCVNEIKDGSSQQAIALALGIPQPAMTRWMKSSPERTVITQDALLHREKKRVKHLINPAELAKIIAFGFDEMCILREAANSQSEIARKIGVRTELMMRWIRDDQDREEQFMKSGQWGMELWLDRGLDAIMDSPADDPLELSRAKAVEFHCLKRAEMIRTSMARYNDKLAQPAAITVTINTEGSAEENL